LFGYRSADLDDPASRNPGGQMFGLGAIYDQVWSAYAVTRPVQPDVCAQISGFVQRYESDALWAWPDLPIGQPVGVDFLHETIGVVGCHSDS